MAVNGDFTVSWTAPVDADYYQMDEKYEHDPAGWRQTNGHLRATQWKPSPWKSAFGNYSYRARACNTLDQCSGDSLTVTVRVELPNVLPAQTSMIAITPKPSVTGRRTVKWNAAARGSGLFTATACPD